MGNSLSTSDTMKNLPDDLSTNQHVEITTNDGKKYYVYRRAIINQIGNNFNQRFTATNIGLGFLGQKLGLGNDLASINRSINKQKESWFYITDEKNKIIRSSVNAILLKLYIKLFVIDPIVQKKYKFDLKTSTFEVKENEPAKNGFGKKRITTLKQLRVDLKIVNL